MSTPSPSRTQHCSPYPDHTDCPIWRRAAPNEPFEDHHVKTLSKGSTSRLPSPNVLEETPDSSRAFVQPHGQYYYDIVFLYVDDTAIGSYDLPGILAEFSRRFEMTTGTNGSTFLGLNVWQDPTTYEIHINFKDYLE